MRELDMSYTARLARYGEAATALALLDDRRLAEQVAGARALGAGIGGTSALLHIGGVPVFVKRVPLTDLERDPGNLRSTANLFGLPAFCQYGAGSPGFGAWRELAANTMTTNWVLAKRTKAFPLMYHSRVLPGAPAVTGERADVESAVAFWGGSPEVRQRLHALAGASASLVLFAEYIPQNLDDWLAARLADGPDAMAAACAMVERCLRTDVTFMNAHGLLHFDAHLRNILTDGHRLYLADLGLATSARFELSADERAFAALNRDHDACHTVTALVNWLVVNVVGIAVPPTGGPSARNDYIRRCAEGAGAVGAPAPVAALIERYAPVVATMNDFYWSIFGESRATAFPAVEIARAMERVPGLAAPPRSVPSRSAG